MTENDPSDQMDEWCEVVHECFAAADDETRGSMVEAAEELGHDRAARIFRTVEDWNRYVSSWFDTGVRDTV